MALISINPANKQVISEIEELTLEQIDEKLAKADEAFKSWRKLSFAERAVYINKIASVLRDNSDEYAKIISSEVGKTIEAAKAEIEKSALAFDYYGEYAEKFLSPTVVETDASESYVRADPIGIVLAVMPWNFPFWQVLRFLAPALMAGNVGVLKHASNVQLSAKSIQDIVDRAGLPEGVFYNLAISSSKVEAIIKDPRVRAVTLTGSEYAGSQVAKQAGEQIKKTVLELGGSDAFIVLEDANIDEAVESALNARLQANAGQSCVASKRFIVHENLINEFSEKLVVAVKTVITGDPLDPKTTMGPLANEQMVNDIERQVNESVEKGAKVLIGGQRIDLGGCYFAPTVLTNLTLDMPVLSQEVFGPAWPIIGFSSVEEAVEIANSSDYGLGGVIFSSDTEKAKNIAKDLDTGSVFINSQVRSDRRLPFGGVKKSGYGRELSEYGIKEFVNIKTVWVK